MSSPVILGKRGRERLKQLQFKSARSKFEDLLPTDTSQEILDGLAKELPLHFWALSLISRGNKVVNVYAKEIYKISEEYYEPTTTNTTTSTTKINYLFPKSFLFAESDSE